MNRHAPPNPLRLLLLLLACAVLLGTLAACGEKAPPEDESAEATAERKEEQSDEPSSYPTSGDYGGQEFRVMQRVEYAYEFDSEGLNSDTVNNAVYARNSLIEKNYNVIISTKNYNCTWQNKQMMDQLTTLFNSNENAFDLIAGYQSYIMPTILNDWYIDWGTVKSVDLNADWWAQGINESSTINGRVYAITGDLAISFWKMMSTMVFNKDWVASVNDGESLYDVVEDDRWTFEYMKELCAKASNNDGESPDKEGVNNVYGFASDWDVAIDGFKEAFDCPTVTKDADGNIKINVSSEKMDAVVTALQDFYDANNDYAYCYRGVDPTNWFRENKAMIVPMRFEMIERLSDLEDYGIIPYPKWDTAQKDYAVSIVDGCSMFLIPKTASQTAEFAGLICTALSDESRELVIPEYYEKVIRNRGTRDPKAYQMLDLIRQVATLEFGQLYSNALDGVGHIVRGTVSSVVHGVDGSKISITTRWDEKRDGVEKALDDLLKFYKK